MCDLPTVTQLRRGRDSVRTLSVAASPPWGKKPPLPTAVDTVPSGSGPPTPRPPDWAAAKPHSCWEGPRATGASSRGPRPRCLSEWPPARLRSRQEAPEDVPNEEGGCRRRDRGAPRRGARGRGDQSRCAGPATAPRLRHAVRAQGGGAIPDRVCHCHSSYRRFSLVGRREPA